MTSLQLHPDRALPFAPEQRSVAREIYGETKDLPLICMHGHVEPEVFADDLPFADPAQLLIVPDHYVFRMLASQGIEPAELGVPRADGVLSSATLERSGGRSARTGSSTEAPRRGTGWSTSSSRSSVSTWCRALRRPTRSMTRSLPVWRIRRSVPAHCWTGSTSRSSRPRMLPFPACSIMRSSLPTVWASACCPPSGRTRSCTWIGRPGVRTSPNWRPCRGSTPPPTTASWMHYGNAARPLSRLAHVPPITATSWPTPPPWT